MVVNAILIVTQVNMTGKVLVFRLYSRSMVTAESTPFVIKWKHGAFNLL